MNADVGINAAFQRVASRERDTLRAFVPGATPENDDVARTATTSEFALDSLSVALPERSYAVVLGDDGRPLYTRDGAFSLRDGVLVDESGRPVQGYAGPNAARSELRVDPVDLALGRCNDVRLDAGGALSYERTSIDPRTMRRTNERVTVGRIALARFPAVTQLQPVDAQHVRAFGDVLPHVGVPADGAFAPLSRNARARAGIDLDASIEALREAYLSLDALASARQVQRGTEKTAMDLLK